MATAAALIAGCGGGDSGDSADPAPRPPEQIDAPAPPPAGAANAINEAGGFSVTVPHGWSAEPRGAVELLTSPDKAVTVAITADRTEEALSGPTDEIARTAITGLAGFTAIKVVGTVPFRAHYPAVAASGSAIRTSDNLRQSFRSFVLTRPKLAVFTFLASRNAKAKTPFAAQVDAIVRSLRGRPVVVPG